MPERLARGAAVIAVALLGACTTVPAPTPAPAAPPPMTVAAAVPAAPAAFPGAAGEVMGRSARMVVYLPHSSDHWRGIASRFLGDPAQAWVLAEAHGVHDGAAVPAGQPLVLPLVARNPVGVLAEQYQTVPILCYHRFGNQASRLIVTPQAFAAQLDWLAANRYRVIRLAELREFLAARKPLPVRSVVITIDDGYESVHRHAWPVLKKHGFPATLFVYTDFVGAADALSWGQLQEMQRSGLVDVQSHSKTHRNLADRGPGETEARYRAAIDAEMRIPREVLAKRVEGSHVQHIAWPYGDANAVVLDSAARHGFELGLTVIPGGNAFFAQPLMLRRTMIFGELDLEGFKARLQTARAWAAPDPGPAALAPADPPPPRAGASLHEQRLLAQATLAEQQGRWADAAWIWEALTLVRPGDSGHQAELARLRNLIVGRVQDGWTRARDAQRRGDNDRAMRGYLLVLSLDPQHAGAAEGLRVIERERNERQLRGRF